MIGHQLRIIRANGTSYINGKFAGKELPEYVCSQCMRNVSGDEFVAMADANHPVVPNCPKCWNHECCVGDCKHRCCHGKSAHCCSEHNSVTRCHHSVDCKNPTTDGYFCDEHRCCCNLRDGTRCPAERTSFGIFCAFHTFA